MVDQERGAKGRREKRETNDKHNEEERRGKEGEKIWRGRKADAMI